MQTFLPYENFKKSAEVLDKKRCWKQVVEAKQIINCLCEKETKWKNHPAVKMWIGYEELLKHYYNIFLQHCINVHKINTKQSFYNVDLNTINKPFWIGNEDFHRAMRSRLIVKDREFYLHKFSNDDGFNDGKYFWPVMESQTFRII